MAGSEINLIKNSAGRTDMLLPLETKLRVISFGLLSLFLLSGLVVGISYVILQGTYQRAEEKKTIQTQQIHAQTTKEGIMVSLKQRVLVAQKALDAVRPWGKLFPLLSSIAPADQFVTLSVEENGRVTTIIETVSIDDAVTVVTNTLIAATQKSLRSPQLLSFAMRANGTVQLGVSFIPVF